MKAFSQDLRKRIVQAVQTTGNQSQVARTFQVSRSTVRRLLKLEAQDPELAPKPRPGRQAAIAAQHYAAVLAIVQAHNDLTLQQLAHLWAQQSQSQPGQSLSISTLSRLLKRLGWTRKKRVWQPPSATPSSALSSRPASLT